MAATRRFLFLVLLAAGHWPALAAPADPTRIPEPDTIAIFLLASAGLVLGRRLSR